MSHIYDDGGSGINFGYYVKWPSGAGSRWMSSVQKLNLQIHLMLILAT